MAYTHDELDTRAERDKVNDALRASDLWRNAIKQMGLNPDAPPKLSKQQQKQLAATIGLSPADFHIDPAGNINDYHGWEGLPTPVKISAFPCFSHHGNNRFSRRLRCLLIVAAFAAARTPGHAETLQRRRGGWQLR